MPEFKGVLVQVVVDGLDKNGKKSRRPLKEWGVQKIKRSKKVSAYIEAETGKRFRILVRPKIPFPSTDVSTAHEHNTRQKANALDKRLNKASPVGSQVDQDWHGGDENLGRRGTSESNFGADPRRRGSSLDASVKIQQELTDEKMIFPSRASSMKTIRKRAAPPSIHLLASLYVDGRKKPEHKAFVLLDPNDDDFNSPTGEVEIETRWVQDKDGNIKEKSWVFQDIGIETMFDKMLIAEDKNSGPVAQQNEAALVNACNSINLNGDNDFDREENSKVGQIVIVIDRVTLGKKGFDTNYQSKHKEHETEEVDMIDAGKEITHNTGFAHEKALSFDPEGVSVVYYHLLKDEGHYATFQFFYRSRTVLQKFNFTGLPKAISYVLPSKRSNMAFKTPLSITSSTSKGCTTGEKGKAVASDIGKKKTNGQGLFSRPVIYRKRFYEGEEFLKKEEVDTSWSDEPKIKSLSSSLLPLGQGSSRSALPPSLLNIHDEVRYNLRSTSKTNKLSLINTSHCISFGQSGLKEVMESANSDPLGLPISVCVPSNPGVDGQPLKSTNEAAGRSASATYVFSSLASEIRDNSKDLNDINDEHEACDVVARLQSEPDQDNSQTCRNKDDQGLSTGIKKLVLGKRGRESEDEDSGVVRTRVKKEALCKPSRCQVQRNFRFGKV